MRNIKETEQQLKQLIARRNRLLDWRNSRKGFYESFTEAFRYIEEQGYKVAGQYRTCYIDGAWNQEDPEKWLSVIQIPIE